MSTTNDESEHAWFAEQMAAYLAGGLEAGERARLESHAAACVACAGQLRRATEIERRMTALFADAAPAADFEDRLLARLRFKLPKRRYWIHPAIRKAAVAAAAVLLLGGTGFVGSEYLETGRLPDWSSGSVTRMMSAAKLRQIGQAIVQYTSETAEYAQSPSLYRSSRDGKGQNVLHGDGHVGFQSNPFVGKKQVNSRPPSEPAVGAGDQTYKQNYDGNDAVLLPYDDATSLRAKPGELRESISDAGDKRVGAGESAGKSRDIDGEDISGARFGVNGTLYGNEAMPETRFKPSDFAMAAPAPEAPTKEDAGAKPQSGQPGQEAPAQRGTPPPSTSYVEARKVIREGVMEFEVESFDSAFTQISKITEEEGGFIAAADSDKLPNGKVRGSVTVRVPPSRLDTLVLKLRALGELKSQRLGSKDISKQYTDLESELRAARAMEERLLEMIRTAQGKVKELLEAEKELGNWRTKIEQIQGQLNYYNNLVSMATLTITAYEKDIKTPASASITEEINTGVETDDVETARTQAIKSIDEAKGRVIESELKQLEAGQLAAKIVAEVPGENAGAVLDRLRQLGKIARLDIQRKQVTTENARPQAAAAGRAPAHIEQAPTRIIISMYNLANVAPRLTSNLNLAGEDVEAVYRAILKRVRDADGRVLSSNLSRQDATQARGSIQFEVKAADADAVLNDVRAAGQVLVLNVTENPDTQNVTTAKQAFAVSIIPASQVPPRETRSMSVQTSDVESAVQSINSAIGATGGRVLESSISQDGGGRTVARLSVEVPLGKADQLVDVARKSGRVRTAESSRNAQVPDGPLARARLNLTIGSGESIVPAERGFWQSIREGLATSVKGLLWSLQLIVIGLCLVGPWALLIWGGWRLAARTRRMKAEG
ncbi:DUF4349 domain-containing protein [Fontivita pretiosa]|uniref:DUF4349 domain-containing protein n=1 Tax=Fontivita pretiosa TaxID=2989684 RepID=UPI003D1749AE